RVTVIRGIERILGNPLTHNLLKQLLPSMSNLIHDTSETVRFAFTKLLLTVKGIHDMKFYEIVSTEHLLARLETETSKKIRRSLIKLLEETYFPYGSKSSRQLVRRAVCFVQENPTAALT